jgi:putative ABC transport system permease protein
VSDSYFKSIELPIVAGRGFTERDDARSAPVAIVNEAFVRRFLAGLPPVGARIAVHWSGQPTVREIVGVVRQIKGRPEETEEFVQLYVPARQAPWIETNLIVRRDAGSMASLITGTRQAVARVDPRLALREFVTFEELATRATSRPRFRATLVGTFAVLALMLAMTGVFGVLAYSVQQRSREFGLRLALGSTSGQILGLVLSAGARVVGTGMAVGLLAAVLLSTALSSFVFGVGPRDPVTFVGVAVVMLTTAAGAGLVPAWRASRTDPATVLRD